MRGIIIVNLRQAAEHRASYASATQFNDEVADKHTPAMGMPRKVMSSPEKPMSSTGRAKLSYFSMHPSSPFEKF